VSQGVTISYKLNIIESNIMSKPSSSSIRLAHPVKSDESTPLFWVSVKDCLAWRVAVVEAA